LINVNEQNYVTMKDHIGLKEENEEMRKQSDKLKLENMQQDTQIQEFKSMIKDLNQVISNANEQKIAQKD